MSDHTPGPWIVWSHGNQAEDDANTRLISAAPDLLEALKGVMGLIASGALVRNIASDAEPDWAIRQIPLVMTLKKAESAIAKAEGRDG